MPAGARPIAQRGEPVRRDAPSGAVHIARPFWDNPRAIIFSIVLLLAILAGFLSLASRSATLAPDFLAEVVLYALLAVDVTMLVALLFVLARSIIKLVVERRRGLPFARFRAKLVAVLLGMTLVPAVLVLIVGSELIRTSVALWFNAPIEEVLTSANQIASDYYQDRETEVRDGAERVARALASRNLAAPDVSAVRDLIASEVRRGNLQMVEVYRVSATDSANLQVEPLVDVAAPTLPQGYDRAVADRLAEQTLARPTEPRATALGGGGELIQSAAVVRTTGGRPVGVVVATDSLTGEFAARARRMTRAYERYNQLRVLRQPLAGVYLSAFLMLTLFILVGATWMGLYLAKRITRPVQRLAAAVREVGAGHLDQRIEPETMDEFGTLVEAFNVMTGELATSRSHLERSALNLERKNLEIEDRRLYMETILERIATGVISLDHDGSISTLNGAAARLLRLDRDVIGRGARTVFAREDLQPLADLLRRGVDNGADSHAQEVTLNRDGRELQLAAVVTTLQSEAPGAGTVMVLDDVTPLIRAQKVAAWREVARRLAHEIKNPLTPIQLSADRLRRHFSGAPPQSRALLEECTSTIAGEVESLKALVDEFSQFARMPPARTVPTDLHTLLNETLALYNGLLLDVSFERRFAEILPSVRVDPEQIRRVMVNLIDNALEAMGRRGHVLVETRYDGERKIVRVIVADDGPGVPPQDRDKLFMPYYSTKRRGSGLGLAIVRRIVAEHDGRIEVGDNTPRGARFTIELPSS
jgi:two-component system nitrogen regulation sensor histidine kinase NtrY